MIDIIYKTVKSSNLEKNANLIFIFFVYVSCFFFLLCAFIYNYIAKFSEQHLPSQISFIDLFLLLSCQS